MLDMYYVLLGFEDFSVSLGGGTPIATTFYLRKLHLRERIEVASALAYGPQAREALVPSNQGKKIQKGRSREEQGGAGWR
jgi:hypothetical protein